MTEGNLETEFEWLILKDTVYIIASLVVKRVLEVEKSRYTTMLARKQAARAEASEMTPMSCFALPNAFSGLDSRPASHYRVVPHGLEPNGLANLL